MDNALLIYEKIIEEEYAGIKSMINVQEENLFLDFKEKSDAYFMGIQNDDKRLYAKALSGFSNASGGVLIWGVKAKELNRESPDIAIEERPIKHLRKFMTDLNSLVSDAITPMNNGIINKPIYVNDEIEIDEGFIITYIPVSDLTPHRALLKDNKYYTRAADNFVLMEHYMLEDSFGRRQKPKLEMFYSFMPIGIDNTKVEYFIKICIRNEGKYIATYPSIRIKTCEHLNVERSGVDGNGNWNLKRLLQTSEDQREQGTIFAGGINDAIHPKTYLEIALLVPSPKWREVNYLKRSLDSEKAYLSFEYDLYAEGCTSIKGKVAITAEEIWDTLGIPY
ncbi:AlbA family DNA-binding domain-containing protein [Paenibacillus sp. FSL M7-1046]|uniref:AlbA family DNA-binding domain-containing protein n=1 Tax=Paenibacillus sp. FSL M7-1046 TaxID=2975315 RepID=UPI0030F4D00A